MSSVVRVSFQCNCSGLPSYRQSQLWFRTSSIITMISAAPIQPSPLYLSPLFPSHLTLSLRDGSATYCDSTSTNSKSQGLVPIPRDPQLNCKGPCENRCSCCKNPIIVEPVQLVCTKSVAWFNPFSGTAC